MSLDMSLCAERSAAVELAPSLPWILRHNYLKALHGLLPLLKPRLVRTIFTGQRMELDNRDFLQAYICMFGFWEPDLSAVIMERLGPGDVALDIGAHVGYDALLMARCVGPNGKVFAFEPDRHSFSRLNRNIDLNRLENVVAINAAVFDREGVATLVEAIAGNSGSRSIARGVTGRRIGEVRLTRLEMVIPRADLARVRLVKIDAEGVEAAILDNLLSLPEIVQARPDLVVELSAFEELQARDLWGRLERLGYQAFVAPNDYSREYYAAWTRPAPLAPLSERPSRMTDVLFTVTG